ncbi:hypothetical protein HHL22_17465 [Hymenobacter sp. RP-2-7]|uniref:Uncharacterized protein n=1 Tax=Hymenobacter polaris TaxID=2682546 RepID=A0A7Y0AGM5_9BACT|nr:hypothetical protein [Hymenobacter polaris]NML66998.1 hypothetical protein [Hymenobacter polaris]
MAAWLIVALLLALIMGLPYSLYLDSLKLEQPVVTFTARIWREATTLVPLLVFPGMLLGPAGVIVTRPAISLLAGLSAFALTFVSLGLGFVFLRLQLTYWRHDRFATPTVYPRSSGPTTRIRTYW